jgi:hypothetical protein
MRKLSETPYGNFDPPSVHSYVVSDETLEGNPLFECSVDRLTGLSNPEDTDLKIYRHGGMPPIYMSLKEATQLRTFLSDIITAFE